MIIIQNKKFNSSAIVKTYNAGLVLEGWEVKSIKLNREFRIENSYIIYVKNELFLKNSFINIYNNIDVKFNRKRKLLLNKNEIKEINEKLINKNSKLIVLNVFVIKNIIKLKLGLILK